MLTVLWAAAVAVGKDTAQTLLFTQHMTTVICRFGELGPALHRNKCAKFDYSKKYSYICPGLSPSYTLALNNLNKPTSDCKCFIEGSSK